MLLIIVAFLLLGPLAEIYVLLKAGGAIGAIPVILLCLTTALIGGIIIRWQGFSAMNSARADMQAGKPPVEAGVDGFFLFVAAPLLMTPGFITDGIGFLLLVPPLRRAIAKAALKRLRRAMEQGNAQMVIRRF